MNRHERRKAAARARGIKGHSAFYKTYIRQLPRAPLDAPLEPGRVHHIVFHHDDWCRFYDTNNISDCNCSPNITRHIEPGRS
jgi:hypothetical protein